MKLSEALPQDVVLQLADGKNYKFSEFHWNAQAAVEKRYGISFVGDNVGSAEAPQPVRSGFDIFVNDYLAKETEAWRFLVFQLLRKHHSFLKEEDIGFLVTPKNQEEVCKVAFEKFIESFPLPEEIKNALSGLLDAVMTKNWIMG